MKKCIRRMEENAPLISVIMPVYNSGKYLEKAVDSILSQSFQDFELILIDDGSSDGSELLCDEFATRDNRVIVIHQKNGGICNARNTALKIARGEYIAFSDHDDEYLPGLLENAYNRATKDNADIVKFKKQELVINHGEIIKKRYSCAIDKTYGSAQMEDVIFHLLNSFMLECVWDSIIKKDLLLKYGIEFDTSFKAGGEDIDFMFKLLPVANRISVIDKFYYVHYIRLGFSTSGKYNEDILQTIWTLPSRLNKCLERLHIDLQNHRDDYILYIMYSFINSLVKHLSKKECDCSFNKKLTILKDAYNASFLPSWFWSQSSRTLIRKSRDLGICYMLCKHRLFFLLIIGNNIRKHILWK